VRAHLRRTGLHLLTCAESLVLRRDRSFLYSNSLSGTIPASLGSLTRLFSLCVRAGAALVCTFYMS
jgi:hypothetical protein